MEQTTNQDWLPYGLPWDKAPLDLSFLYADEKPAGKHGFLTVDRNHFTFEDMTEARFWGTLFNAAANFPSHEHSEIIAKRLAAFGVNMVRTHQMDAEWGRPNIFDFSRGNLRNDSMSFDPRSLDRLDYLFYCLKQEGIYVYLDQLSHRAFKPGDGADNIDELPEGGRPYTNYDPRLIELQKKYSYDLWTHVNPYTGLAYKDDPVIALMEVANENDLLSRSLALEPYRSRLETMYRSWARDNGVDVAAEPVNFNKLTDPIIHFLAETQRNYYREMKAYLRSIGVRVPITGSNWSFSGAHLLYALQELDYTDSHTYWDMWSHLEGNNRPNIREEVNLMAKELSMNRLLDRPFFVSEWDVVYPNEWRATSPLMMAAVAGLQDWSGLTIHTYSYRTKYPKDSLGAVVMNGVGYRVNFDTYNDPAKFGLFYHAALMHRKKHIRAADKTVGIRVKQDELFVSEAMSEEMWGTEHSRPSVPAMKYLPEIHRVGMLLPGQSCEEAEEIGRLDHLDRPSDAERRADTGEIYRNPSRGTAWIDTAMTKAVYGFVGKQDAFRLNGLTVRVETPFAVVALSSLTEEPLVNSSNILLTAVGRADNTGARYNADHTRRLDLGHGPIRIEPIKAEIELDSSVPGLNILSIDPDGMMTSAVAGDYVDGKVKFTIGGEFPSMYYLIQRIPCLHK